ncbi:MAG TPA: class C sortase, partial [Clostridiales bacterium]|nr:class C sortase [Clostridiales bacterium]
GAPGNLVIFGHRMRRYGSIFNRLGEVCIGDSIVIERSGQAFTYTVDAIDTVEPSSLSAYIGMEKEGDPESCRITLITCTPIGVGSHRLVITAHRASGG